MIENSAGKLSKSHPQINGVVLQRSRVTIPEAKVLCGRPEARLVAFHEFEMGSASSVTSLALPEFPLVLSSSAWSKTTRWRSMWTSCLASAGINAKFPSISSLKVAAGTLLFHCGNFCKCGTRWWSKKHAFKSNSRKCRSISKIIF
jgi:hypothetical protein